MNFEAQVIAVRTMTNDVQLEITKLSGALKPKPNSHGYNELLRKVGIWQTRIDTMERSLKSQLGLIEKSHHSHLRGPGSYSARQSYASRTGNVAKIRAMLLTLAESIVELLRKLDGGENDKVNFFQALNDALKNITKTEETLEIPQSVGQKLTAEIRQHTGPGQPVPAFHPGMSTGILTMIALLLATAKKMIDKRRNA